MTSWEIIREALVRGEEKTVGYQRTLLKAADIFLSLRFYLKDFDDGIAILNADKQLRSAILNRAGIDKLSKEMGWE